MEYTALVPNDISILLDIRSQRNANDTNGTNSIPTTVDPYLADANARNTLVGSHILKGRHTITSLKPGSVVTTLLNDILPVTTSQGRLNIYIYSL